MKLCWCIPPHHNARFVAAMEDVLSVYACPYDSACPVVCMDEKPFQLLAHSRKPIKGTRNKPEREDSEYLRKGTCSIFLFSEPLAGWWYVDAKEHRTKKYWAYQIKHLLDVGYPETKKVVLVMDNLNTHDISSLYEAFDPEEAFRLVSRLEIHFTPKHGSWLNMAEIELSALSRHCTIQEDCRIWHWYVKRSDAGTEQGIPFRKALTGNLLRKMPGSSLRGFTRLL